MFGDGNLLVHKSAEIHDLVTNSSQTGRVFADYWDCAPS